MKIYNSDYLLVNHIEIAASLDLLSEWYLLLGIIKL